MRVELYRRRDDRLWCTIIAELSDGCFAIRGHDVGPQVEEFFPEGEYEYAVSLDKESTLQFFESLGCAEESDEKKLQIVKDTFENDQASSAVLEYCKERGIKNSFWSWP